MSSLIVIYLLYWIVLSERFTVEGIIVGSLISTAVFYFNIGLKTKINFKKLKYWLVYFIILIREIVISNIHVAKIVLSPNMDISPKLVKIKTEIKSGLNKSIFANSITLTPGTLTINVFDDELLIHCLEYKSEMELQNSKFEKIIMKVEE